MLNRSEAQRLRRNKERMDEILAPVDEKFKAGKTWFGKYSKKTMNSLEKAFDWYFFYNKAKDKGDKAYHIILWLLVSFTLLRLFGIVQ